MIIIPVNSVRSFKHKASKISPNKVLPVCNFIRIQYSKGICTMTKTNNYAFITEEFDAEGKEDQEYMIQELDLFAFVEYSADQFLTIKKEKGRLLLVDSNSTAPCLTTQDAFPLLEIPNQETTELSSSLIKDIKKAAKMVADDPSLTWQNHVFLGERMVIGCDGFVALSIPCELDCRIIFRKEVIAALPDVGAIYKQNKSYDFFECGRAIYGFIKPEQGFFDMTKGIKIPDKKAFELQRKDLLSFNDWVLSIAKKPEFADIQWEYKDGSLILNGYDTFSEKSVERKIKATGGETFKYLPMQLNKLLKAIDDDILICYRGQNNVCITNESRSFISLIQQIV